MRLHGGSGMFTRIARRPWIRLLALGLLLGFAFQGTRSLWNTDEGRYVDGALQMLASGNYLVPAYSPDRINLSKPPVTYWMIAGTIKAFGHNTWAVRTPYALAFALTVLALYAMGKRLLPERPWLPGLIYGCSVVPFFAANVVSTDIFLTLFEAVAALGFVRLSFSAHERASLVDQVLMWLGLGMAFLTKGPPGLIMLLAVVPFVITRDGWRGLRRVFPPVGMCVFLIVALLWYAVVVWRVPHALHYFLYREVYQRIFTGAQRRNPGAWGWLIYLPTLAIGALPWWPLLFGKVRRGLSLQRVKFWFRQHPAAWFVLLWFLIPLLVFCFAQSRLQVYLLPLFMPIALLLAFTFRREIDPGRSWQRILLCVWVLVLLTLKAGVAYFDHPAWRDNRLMARQLMALTNVDAYGAMVFVEATPRAYAVEEHTPWGLRLYMKRPIYGIAWSAPGDTERLCRAIHSHHAALAVLDPSTTSAAIQAIEAHCPVRSVVHLGLWRHRELALFKT